MINYPLRKTQTSASLVSREVFTSTSVKYVHFFSQIKIRFPALFLLVSVTVMLWKAFPGTHPLGRSGGNGNPARNTEISPQAKTLLFKNGNCRNGQLLSTALASGESSTGLVASDSDYTFFGRRICLLLQLGTIVWPMFLERLPSPLQRLPRTEARQNLRIK